SGAPAAASGAAGEPAAAAATDRCGTGPWPRTAARSPRRPGAPRGRWAAIGGAVASRSDGRRRGRRLPKRPSFLVLVFVVVSAERQVRLGLLHRRDAPIRLAPRVPGGLAEVLLDPQQLVVLGRPLLTGRRGRLDL